MKIENFQSQVCVCAASTNLTCAKGRAEMGENMVNVMEAMEKRSSTRGYTSDAISDEELKVLIHAGLQAPTATNRQEVHFTVLKGNDPVLQEIEEEKNRLRNLSAPEHNFYYEAPAVIFLSAEEGFRWSTMDAGIAVENMALAAEGLGLGSLVIGCIYDALRGEKQAYFSERLRFPDKYHFEIAIAVGHKGVAKAPHTYDAEARVSYL